MKLKKIVLLLIINLIISGSGIANEKAAVISGKIIFESTQGFREDKANSIYVWENGKSKKIFTGGFSPRFNQDGTKIAVGEWKTDNILILSNLGEVLQRLTPSYYSLELGWMDENTIFYVGTEKGKISRPKSYLMTIDLDTEEESNLYATTELGQIYNPSWNQNEKFFVFGLSEKKDGDSDLVARVAFFYSERKSTTTQYVNGFTPVLLKDGRTLIFTTNHLPDGTRIETRFWSVLMKYDILTKEYEIIRPTAWVRNMRLSQDGKYLYTSEEVEKDGVGIYVYSVENLKEPIYVIPPMKDQEGTLSQDLKPDWIY